MLFKFWKPSLRNNQKGFSFKQILDPIPFYVENASQNK